MKVVPVCDNLDVRGEGLVRQDVSTPQESSANEAERPPQPSPTSTWDLGPIVLDAALHAGSEQGLELLTRPQQVTLNPKSEARGCLHPPEQPRQLAALKHTKMVTG